jgi:hypothetical protein
MQSTATERSIAGLTRAEAEALRIQLIQNGFLNGLESKDPAEVRRVVGSWLAVEEAARRK